MIRKKNYYEIIRFKSGDFGSHRTCPLLPSHDCQKYNLNNVWLFLRYVKERHPVDIMDGTIKKVNIRISSE